MSTNHVPLVDLAWQHRQIAEEVRAGFDAVLDATAFVDGADVAAFEAEFARYCGVAHCLGVGNGTDAIELALRAGGIGAGDEVILPANTFIATAEAVVRAGAEPVLVDCDPVHLLIDPDAAAEAITARTRAVIGVHLYGQVAPMERLAHSASDGRVLLFEDAAQAQGARRHGLAIGAWGAAAATSFYPGKNLGAYGDGGAVLTGDAELAGRVRRLRAHGSEVRYVHTELGFNSRLDTLQAVVLRAKLARLDAWNELRREAAARYDELLAGVGEVERPATMPGNEHVWHLYVIQTLARDAVAEEMKRLGVGVGVHYPAPIHLQPAFAHLGLGRGAFPVAEAAAGRILSLPLWPGITAEQQELVVEALEKALAAR